MCTCCGLEPGLVDAFNTYLCQPCFDSILESIELEQQIEP